MKALLIGFIIIAVGCTSTVPVVRSVTKTEKEIVIEQCDLVLNRFFNMISLKNCKQSK